MGSKIQKVFQVYTDAEQYLAKTSIKVDAKKVKKIMESVYSPGPSIQMIFDFPKRQFDFVSEDVKEILGYDHKTFSPEMLAELIHPTDFNHVIKCETIAGKFLYEFIDIKEIPYYKVTYQYRIKDNHNNFRCFLHQAITLSLDREGNLSKTLVNLSDISYITSINNYKVSFIDTRNKKSYSNISKFKELYNEFEKPVNFSEREIEILRLISEGFSSQEIANKLFISKNTVRTHRNNILQKSELKTIPQAIAHLIREGFL